MKNNKTKLVCEQCGIEFYRKKSWVDRSDLKHTFCSRDCHNKFRSFTSHESLVVNCKTCGKEVKKSPNTISRNDSFYCSRACWKKSLIKSFEVKCQECRELFAVTNYRLNKANSKYCSRKCKDKAQSVLLQKPPKEKICIICGKTFLVGIGHRSRNAKTCSLLCDKINRSDKLSMENNPRWNNGSSFGDYSLKFTDKVKEQIRNRDNRICQLCGKDECQNGRKLDIHHTNYNKQDTNKYNLIALCTSCHTKTNSNREYWIAVFDAMIKEAA